MNNPGYHKRYYLENNVDDMLLKARNRVEELTIIKTIAAIDAKLRVLNAYNTKLYAPPKTQPPPFNPDDWGDPSSPPKAST